VDEMLFILFYLKRELSGDKYCTIIQQQNTYLKNHRKISIVGVGNLRVHEPANYENDIFHFNHLLRSKPCVYRIDSTKRTPGLGKWNIFTDKKNYIAVTTWIDSNILAFFELVTAHDTEIMEDFPTPRRLLRVTSTPKSVSSSSSYAKKLQT
jgi:hypothetical protein